MEHLWTIAARDADAGRPGALRAGVAVAQRAAALDGLDAPSRFSITPDEERFERLIEGMLERSGHREVEEADVLELEVLDHDEEATTGV